MNGELVNYWVVSGESVWGLLKYVAIASGLLMCIAVAVGTALKHCKHIKAVCSTLFTAMLSIFILSSVIAIGLRVSEKTIITVDPNPHRCPCHEVVQGVNDGWDKTRYAAQAGWTKTVVYIKSWIPKIER